MRTLSRLLATGLDGLAPTHCLECGALAAGPEAPFCSTCCSGLPWWRAIDGCPRCGLADGALPTLDDFDVSDGSTRARERGTNRVGRAVPDVDSGSARACPGCHTEGSALHASQTLLRYVAGPRVWIPRFKHHSSPFGPPLASRLAVAFYCAELARVLARRIAQARLERPGLILPIPLHPRRHRLRGFNQSHWIADQIGRVLSVHVASRTLVRLRNTPAQAFLDARARRTNLAGAFGIRTRAALPSRIWLVDDVLTTGATLESAAETLLGAGVDEVIAITLAATQPLAWPRRRPKRASKVE